MIGQSYLVSDSNFDTCFLRHYHSIQYQHNPPKQPKSEHLFTMSKEYEGQDLQDIAKQAEQDLASHSLKRGAQEGGLRGKTDKGGSTSSK